jgi:hypothetical protein
MRKKDFMGRKIKYVGESDEYLTNGKIYEVKTIDCNYYAIVDDLGELWLYHRNRFERCDF